MYEKFYGLSVDPFRLSPDHRFSFSHPSYAKAKAYIKYALHRAEGFVMVTGKPGTGKTTLVNDVLDGLSASEVVVANLVSTQLEADDLLRMVAYSFGLGADGPHKALVLQRVMDFLSRQQREGRRALLVIDEAQDLSVSALEELRLLTNLQRAGRPLLQIVLLGQELLKDLVRRPEMEQVHQRLIAASDLEPLGRADTLAYIGLRLGRAGWRGDPTFEREVWPLIYEFSGGVPRRINLVCSRLLLHGCVEERHALTAEDAASVAAELQQEELAPTQSGVDAGPLPARVSAGRQSSQQGVEPQDQALEEESGRGRGDPDNLLTDWLAGYVDADIAGKPNGLLEIGDITRELRFAQNAPPAVVSDARGPSVFTPGERPAWASSPHGQQASGHPETEERESHGRSHRRDRLPEDSRSRLGASRGQEAEAPGGPESSGWAEQPTQEPWESRGSRGSPRKGAAHTANANVRAPSGESESWARATGRVRSKGARAGWRRRTWRSFVLLALGLVVLVGAGFYFRPHALEPELAWLERRMAAIPATARALLGRLTGVDGKQRPENRYPLPLPLPGVGVGVGVGEVGRTVAQRDEHAAAGGGTGEDEEGAGGRRVGPAEPKDATEAIGD